MNETKIDWAEMSWNPVTGCRHGCPYCYARRTAHRFDAGLEDSAAVGGLHVLEERIKGTPYPYGFEPTLHRYRLDQPERKKEGRTVFVCSMADLFGRWVDAPHTGARLPKSAPAQILVFDEKPRQIPGTGPGGPPPPCGKFLVWVHGGQ